MKDFPDFMKNSKNRVDTKDQNTQDIIGYYFEGADGTQMAFWTCYSNKLSKTHTHEFDEYLVCVHGEYTVIIGDEETVLKPGDEFVISKGTPHSSKRLAGTRTIHAFGGKRIQGTSAQSG
jgi:quercetin dioxygenase-like cupin family protein